MGLIQDGDLGKILQDQALMEQIVSGLVEDSGTMDTLADDIADKVQDALENNADLRQQLVSAAIANDAFKQRLVGKLIEELS